MPDYTFDVTMAAVATVTATDEAGARRALERPIGQLRLDGAGVRIDSVILDNEAQLLAIDGDEVDA